MEPGGLGHALVEAALGRKRRSCGDPGFPGKTRKTIPDRAVRHPVEAARRSQGGHATRPFKGTGASRRLSGSVHRRFLDGSACRSRGPLAGPCQKSAATAPQMSAAQRRGGTTMARTARRHAAARRELCGSVEYASCLYSTASESTKPTLFSSDPRTSHSTVTVSPGRSHLPISRPAQKGTVPSPSSSPGARPSSRAANRT
mmetsp:Transcript_28303/g.97456  ORF Transcript_28303/g.97456 Transcript_28303/m.97456 type:complete len:201 (+) Transcript_28303:1464-2066(+)